MIGDLKPYPEMKESSVEWLGQVPTHKEVQIFGRCLTDIGQDWSRVRCQEGAEEATPLCRGSRTCNPAQGRDHVRTFSRSGTGLKQYREGESKQVRTGCTVDI